MTWNNSKRLRLTCNQLKWFRKELKNAEKVKGGQTDRQTDRPTKRVVELRSTRLKSLLFSRD